MTRFKKSDGSMIYFFFVLTVNRNLLSELFILFYNSKYLIVLLYNYNLF